MTTHIITDPDGSLDDVIITDVESVHIERMDYDFVSVVIRSTNGEQYTFSMFSYGKLHWNNNDGR